MRHRQFDRRDGIGRRNIHDDDPFPGAAVDVDVIHADTGADERFHLFGSGNELLIDIRGRAGDRHVGIGDDVEQGRFVDVGREHVINLRIVLKHLQTGFVDIVAYDYFVFFHHSSILEVKL